MTKRRFALAVLLGLLVATADLHAQTFTAQIQQFWNLLRTGSIAFTKISLGTGGTNNLPNSQLLFFSVSQDSIFRMVLENRSATANSDTELKLVNGTGTAFLGVNNINNTSNGPQTVPAGAHRSWLDISDNTAGSGWDIGGQAAALVTRFYTGGYTAANFRVWVEPTVFSLKNGEFVGFDAGTGGNDAGLSRLGAASLAFGNGTVGDFTGTLKLGTMNAVTSYQINGVAGATHAACSVSVTAITVTAGLITAITCT